MNTGADPAAGGTRKLVCLQSSPTHSQSIDSLNSELHNNYNTSSGLTLEWCVVVSPTSLKTGTSSATYLNAGMLKFSQTLSAITSSLRCCRLDYFCVGARGWALTGNVAADRHGMRVVAGHLLRSSSLRAWNESVRTGVLQAGGGAAGY